jgi:hypothetical protein
MRSHSTVEINSMHAKRWPMENYKGFIIFGGVSTDEEGAPALNGLVCMRVRARYSKFNVLRGQLLEAKKRPNNMGSSCASSGLTSTVHDEEPFVARLRTLSIGTPSLST